MRQNTPEEMKFQEAIRDVFVEYDGSLGFAKMVDVLLAFVVLAALQRGSMKKGTFIKVVEKTWSDVESVVKKGGN